MTLGIYLYDSTTNAPVANATVRIEETGQTANNLGGGFYEITGLEDLPRRLFTLVVEHRMYRRFIQPVPPTAPLIRIPLVPITATELNLSNIQRALTQLEAEITQYQIHITNQNVGQLRDSENRINNAIRSIIQNIDALGNIPERDQLLQRLENARNRFNELRRQADRLRGERTRVGRLLTPARERFRILTGGPAFRERWVIASIVTLISIILLVAFAWSPLSRLLGGGSAGLIIGLTSLVIFLVFSFGYTRILDSIGTNWPNLTIAALITLLATFGVIFPLLNNTPVLSDIGALKWFIPGVIFVIITISVGRERAGVGKTLVHSAIWIVIGIVIIWGIQFFTSGAAFEFETYVNSLNILKFVGVPKDTIENMKEGIRNTLSFLQFKAVEPITPEAEKIGGFEAIQLKFGSEFNNFAVPTLFARMNYTLPITIANPNTFDTGLVVKNFKIDTIYLNNKSSERILCGSGGDDEQRGEIGQFDLQPEEERIITVKFGNKTDCVKVAQSYINNPNPLFPVEVEVQVDENEKESRCQESSPPEDEGDNDTACTDRLQDFYNRYFENKDTRPKAISKDVEATYDTKNKVCICKLNRYHNIMDNLCFVDKAKITMRSKFDFEVQGKGELIIIKEEVDRKLAPKPVITSGAGPLTVTTYFVSDIHSEETPTSIMFIQIDNDGNGQASLKNVEPLVSLDDQEIVTIGECSPTATETSPILVDEKGITISCPVTVNQNFKSMISGSYLTVPVIVNVEYTYLQTHSVNIPVEKKTIPENVGDEKARELHDSFKALPYYCPNDKSKEVSKEVDGVEPLKIY